MGCAMQIHKSIVIAKTDLKIDQVCLFFLPFPSTHYEHIQEIHSV